MSMLGASETFSHEGYGHALMYIQNGYDHNGASHSFGAGNTDTNIKLSEQIKDSRRETIKNFRE